LVEIFDRLAPALKKSGSLWVNLGDTYFARWSSIRADGRQGLGTSPRTRRVTPTGDYLHDKQLLMVPARFAIAMQDAGWILRNDVIWSKAEVPPRPQNDDRLRLSHEHVFHFVHRHSNRRPTYYYDLAAAESGGRDVVQVNRTRGRVPDTFYVTGPDGYIRPVSDYQWGQALPVKPVAGGKYQLAGTSGPCAAGINLFAPNTDVLVYASAPSQGFRFLGWTGYGPDPVPQTPLHKITDDTAKTLPGSASYLVACHTVTFGEGIHVAGDAPYCPGSTPAERSFIFGMSIPVRADYRIGDRTIEKFTSGVAADQISEDPATLDWYGYVTVGVGTKVTALYQSSADRTNTEILKGFKFGAGIVAVVLPVVLGTAFPPLGMFFAAMGTIAGISSFIPGGQGAAALFDLLNPTKITGCIARWGFTNAGSPGGQQNIGSMISTGKTIGQAVFTTKDLLTFDLGPLGVAGGAASIGYGLYDAGIGGANMVGAQSVEELAGRSTITGCLDDVWRITGSNLSGSG
jgi:hypothetical protein